MKIIAIDFDGTIMNPRDIPEGKKMGNPMPGCKEQLKEYKRQGHTIVVHSVRGSSPQHLKDWLHFYGIPFDRIEAKFPADVYIDDRGRQFTDWNQEYL